MQKRQIKLVIDICMTVLLPMLMAYSLIGEKFHEITGTMMLVMVIIHHILNRGWHKAILKGKYSPRRVFQTVHDVFLLVFMVMQPVSGILMSKHLYTFIHVEGASSGAREVHICIAYWVFVLMCIHAGAHLTALFNKLKRSNHTAWKIMMVALVLISLYGCRAFVKRQLPEYMFRRTVFAFFDYAEPRAFFFIDYISIMVLFAFAGFLTITCISRKTKKDGGK